MCFPTSVHLWGLVGDAMGDDAMGGDIQSELRADGRFGDGSIENQGALGRECATE